MDSSVWLTDRFPPVRSRRVRECGLAPLCSHRFEGKLTFPQDAQSQRNAVVLRSLGERQMPQSWEARLNPLLFVRYSGAEGSARSAWSQIVSPASIRSLGAADMDVQGLGAAYGLSPLRPVTGQPVGRPATIAAPQLSPQDEVQISSAAKLLDQASQVSDLRSERLAQIRAEIANGTYDTDEKLEAALGRLINSLGQDID